MAPVNCNQPHPLGTPGYPPPGYAGNPGKGPKGSTCGTCARSAAAKPTTLFAADTDRPRVRCVLISWAYVKAGQPTIDPSTAACEFSQAK